MRASYSWLKELSGVDASVERYAARLNELGLEVEAIEEKAVNLVGVVVGKVLGKSVHPEREKLTLVSLDVGGAQPINVVCGASNVPDAGGHVAVATVGASLPNGMAIEERKLGGVLSQGMICSEAELGIGLESDGILVLDNAHQAGATLVEALQLSDVIFEIGITPNRPDALGHLGIAREIAVGFSKPFAPAKRKLLSAIESAR
ncbi:MAG: phenylalanine--tRNA ligase subunit beta, partial [Polyangiales bacterium]